MIEKIHVIDNVIPKKYQNYLETNILSRDFPWYFVPADSSYKRPYVRGGIGRSGLKAGAWPQIEAAIRTKRANAGQSRP